MEHTSRVPELEGRHQHVAVHGEGFMLEQNVLNSFVVCLVHVLANRFSSTPFLPLPNLHRLWVDDHDD